MGTQAVPIRFLGHQRHPPVPKHSSRLLLALAIVDDLPEAALEQVGQRFLVMIHQDSIKTPTKTTSRNYTIIYVICGSLWKWWSLNPLVFVLMNYQIIIFPSIFFPWCHFMIFQDILCTVYPIFRQIYDRMPCLAWPILARCLRCHSSTSNVLVGRTMSWRPWVTRRTGTALNIWRKAEVEIHML